MFPILWGLLQSIVFTVFSNAGGMGLSSRNRKNRRTPKKANVTSAYIIHFPSTSSLPTNPFRTHPNLAFCLRDPSVFIVGWASRVGGALGIADLIAATYHHCTPIWPNGRIFHQPRFPWIAGVPFPLLFTTIWRSHRSCEVHYKPILL